MTARRSAAVLWVATLALLAGAPGAGARAEEHVPLSVVAERAVFKPRTGTVRFVMRFNRCPDFHTADAFGRQADSFQYFVVGDETLPYPDLYDAVVRGEEIHVAGGELRIRNAVGPDADPASGGWGPLRGAVPFRLRGPVLRFSVPLAMLSDHSRDGAFAYVLETYEYGAITGSIESRSIVRVRPGRAASPA